MKSTTLEQLRKWTFRVSIAVIVFQAIIHLNDMPEALAEGGGFFIGYLIGVAITLAPNSRNMEAPTETAPAYICYVNGVKVEDDKVAYAEANRILGSLSEDVQLAMAEVNRLTHYTIAK